MFISISTHQNLQWLQLFPPLVISSMSIDPNVEQAIIHVSTLKLRRIIHLELTQCIDTPLKNNMQDILVKVLSPYNRQSVTPVITILHKLEMKRIINQYPQLRRQQVNRLCRQYTKLFVKNLIKKELKEQSPSSTKANQLKMEYDEYQQNAISLENKPSLENQSLNIIPMAMQIIPVVNLKVENMNGEREIDKISSISATPKGSLQQNSCKTQYQSERGNIKTQSLNHNNHNNHNHNILAHLSPATTLAACEKENSTHVIQQTESYGHFDFGDELDQIKDVFLVEHEIFGILSWKPRFDGVIPEQSTLSARCIRKYVPLELSEFYGIFLQKMKRRKRYLKSY